MAQPQWITPAGSLGVVPEGVFYSVPVQAEANGEDVYFKLIAGTLPDGIQIATNGVIEGVPRNTVRVQGVPAEVSADVTSRFAIRAYTVKIINGVIITDRLADRTFTITISGQDVPEFITPAGNVGTFYDGTEASIQIDFTDVDPSDDVIIKVIQGELPPGLFLDRRTGLISGVILPLTADNNGATQGYSATEFDQYAFDFTTRASSRNFQFTLEVSDGFSSNIRTFEIFVYCKANLRADTTSVTADNTFVTADVTPDRPPILLTPEGDLGRVRSDNFYAFKFDGIDFDGEPIEYSVSTGVGTGFSEVPYDTTGFSQGTFALPPGLQINPDTGWFYGYIPDQGATEQTYQFAIQVKQKIELAVPYDPALFYTAGDVVSYLGKNYTALVDVPPNFFPSNTSYWELQYVPTSRLYYFTLTVVGIIDTEVFWLTDPDLGSILNGAISTLFVAARTRSDASLQYRIPSGSNSKLPEGLTLQPSGNITGRVSFNTFCLDGGSTTFDVNAKTSSNIGETTFDLTYSFTVNAFSSNSIQQTLQIDSFVIVDGGMNYTGQPTVLISAPPPTADSVQATAGAVTISGGKIVSIAVGNPGKGYTSPPTITIVGGGGTGASVSASMAIGQQTNVVSVFRRFTIRVDRFFNQPYESLYIKCMPPYEDRAIIDSLIQNQDIIPVDLVYRPDDPNFGVAKNVTYVHAYGLNSASMDLYAESLGINHYWRNLTLGEIRTAQALDADGNVLYEVVYSQIVDDLVNSQNQSVSKSVRLPYAVDVDGETVEVVYPNSLPNMRDQVVDTVGQISTSLVPILPAWMTSKQPDGNVLGFTPAWVIAYVNPGQSGRVAYNIRTQFTQPINAIDFKVDRYEIDRSQTWQWDPANDEWQPQPPAATTFDSLSDPSQVVGWQNNSLIPCNWINQNSQPVLWITPSQGFSQDGTVFDGGSTRFITPTVRWIATDSFDKYLVFPRIDILQ